MGSISPAGCLYLSEHFLIPTLLWVDLAALVCRYCLIPGANSLILMHFIVLIQLLFYFCYFKPASDIHARWMPGAVTHIALHPHPLCTPLPGSPGTLSNKMLTPRGSRTRDHRAGRRCCVQLRYSGSGMSYSRETKRCLREIMLMEN